MVESAPAKPRKVTAAVSRRAAPDPVWKDIWNNRSILWLLVRRDLKSRYAGSMLGVMWNIINPVVMIIIYILILGTILGGKFGGGTGGQTNYALHLCAGMIPWLAFQEIVLRCSGTLLENANLIKKVAFPEVVLHLVVFINAIVIHTISYTAFILILSALGKFPGAAAFACYGILVAISLFGLGFGLIFSVLNIYFRDVGQIVSIAMQFLFWFMPIVYMLHQFQESTSLVKHLLLKAVSWNPLTHFVQLSQWCFGDIEAVVSKASLAVVIITPIAALMVGLALFNRFKHDLLDNI